MPCSLQEVRQLPERPKQVGGDQGQAGPSTLSLHIPVSSAKDGIFKDYDLPAFRADLDPDLKVSISLHITVSTITTLACASQ